LFFYLGDAAKDLDLQGCRIKTVVWVFILGAIGDSDDFLKKDFSTISHFLILISHLSVSGFLFGRLPTYGLEE
jgi:hypothetical protein